MPTNQIPLGTASEFYVRSVGGAAIDYVLCGGNTSFSMRTSESKADITTKDTLKTRGQRSSRRSGMEVSASLSFMWDELDPGIVKLLDWIWTAGALLEFKALYTPASGRQVWTGTLAVPDSSDMSAPMAEGDTFDLECSLNDVVKATQA